MKKRGIVVVDIAVPRVLLGLDDAKQAETQPKADDKPKDEKKQ